MDEKRWQEIEQIVDTALTKDKSQRKKYIQKACKGDKDLIKSVTQLLENIEKSGETNYLEDPNVHQEFRSDLAESVDQPAGKSLVGKQIGQYEINDLIGHGGMGSVYLAERTSGTYQQTVALKVMRRGMDTPANIARFKREQHILAKLNHPNIARLIDGGITDENLPYLVMEYVDGIPLYEYCDTHQLSINDRLELFQSVCHAVQHAHSNTVIHRDLKPSNILITKDGTVKVLDFGIAKLLEPENPKTTFFETRTGARMLTFGYAAPEQIEGETVTTATDSYTLGVLLYELLAGVHPFDLENKNLTEIEQVIREKVPTSPSNKFRQLPEEEKGNIATERNTNPSALADILKGDLDAIVMKALRKGSDKRYKTVEQFLNDLQRRKTNKPIVAREDTLRYKTTKFLKRHKTLLSWVAATLLIISGIVTYYTVQLAQQRNRAQLEAQKAEQVTTFLTNLIEANYPANAQGDAITVREFLDMGYQKVQELNRSPAVKANIMQVMSHTYRSLGDIDKAHTLITQIIEMQDTVAIKQTERAKSYNLYGLILRDQGDIKKAEQMMQRSLELYQEIGQTNNQDFAKLLRDLAYIKRMNSDYEEALRLVRRAIALEEQLYGKNHIRSAETYYVLASILRYQGKYQKAKKEQLKSLNILQQQIDGPHPGKLSNYNNLANLYEIQDSLKKAESYYTKGLNMSHKIYGDYHQSIATHYSNLSAIMKKEGKLDSAETLLHRAMDIRKKVSGPNHPKVGHILSEQGNILRRRGEFQKADSLFKRAAEIFKSNYEENHPSLISLKYNRALNAYSMGSYNHADELARQVFGIRKERHNISKDLVQEPLELLVESLNKQGKKAEADSMKQAYRN